MEKESLISISESAGIILLVGFVMVGVILSLLTSMLPDEENPQQKVVEKLKKKEEQLKEKEEKLKKIEEELKAAR